MAEIRESQRRLQEDLAEAKGKLADIHADRIWAQKSMINII